MSEVSSMLRSLVERKLHAVEFNDKYFDVRFNLMGYRFIYFSTAIQHSHSQKSGSFSLIFKTKDLKEMDFNLKNYNHAHKEDLDIQDFEWCADYFIDNYTDVLRSLKVLEMKGLKGLK